MKIAEALNAAAARLAGMSDTPRLDAELLMAEAAGVSREQFLLSGAEGAVPAGFEALVQRRLAGEPVAYITGRRAFWSIELEVGPGALVPRPDSETLIEAALEHFGKAGPKTVLDLGTGPGTLLLATLDQWHQARGIGIDRSEEALDFARRNAERLGFGNRAAFRIGDWIDGLEERFDLVLCNPPYIDDTAELPRDVKEWEPHSALFAGTEGLDDYRRLAPMTGELLTEGGIACFEIGVGQEEAVRALFIAEGLKVRVKHDLGGRARCLIVER
ncbi:MAG TPA: peptide chain release factor N(5)-glutamine methyltransferase [Allosphingosinicella sp.]|uniref:peptide chain release factor N(5)-glutamine methyltransferase n=1 Tax=Allosphingosinicella sp. TaxID=2823234 RepID=UPI002ED8A87D